LKRGGTPPARQQKETGLTGNQASDDDQGKNHKARNRGPQPVKKGKGGKGKGISIREASGDTHIAPSPDWWGKYGKKIKGGS